MQQTPLNMWVQVFDCGRFGVGVIAPNAFSLGIAPPSVRRVWILSSAKFGVDWSRNVGGVGKKQFCGFCNFAKKNYGRKWAWPMPKDAADSSE